MLEFADATAKSNIWGLEIQLVYTVSSIFRCKALLKVNL